MYLNNKNNFKLKQVTFQLTSSVLYTIDIKCYTDGEPVPQSFLQSRHHSRGGTRWEGDCTINPTSTIVYSIVVYYCQIDWVPEHPHSSTI